MKFYKEDKIIFQTNYKYSQPKKNMGLNIVAFDTETIDGNCILLMNNLNQYIIYGGLDEYLDFLSGFGNSVNFFFNLRFDVEGIIKLLPKNNIIELLEVPNKTIYKDYYIDYINNKYFGIKKIGKKYKRSHFFDIWQFYEKKHNLNKLGSIYFNLPKDELPFKIGDIDINDFKKNEKIIKKYCLKDCEITKKLSDLMYKQLEKLKIIVNRPYSHGKIAETLMLKNNNKFPKIKDKEVLRYWLRNYSGGRFETIVKGRIKNTVKEVDLNGAYNYWLTQLFDISSGGWNKVYDRSENYDYGVYRCIIDTLDYKETILPIFYRNNKNLILFPSYCEIIYLNNFELDILDKLDVYYDILDGHEIQLLRHEKPFEYVGDMYNWRKELKYEFLETGEINKKYDPILSDFIKKAVNSSYGKTISTKPFTRKLKKKGRKFIDFDEWGNLFYITIFNALDDPENYHIKRLSDDSYDIYKIEGLIGSMVFNPLYASLITSLTRLQLLECAVDIGFSDIIAFATDSILTTGDIPDKYIGKDLGQFELKEEGKCHMLMNGIYKIGDKQRCRGFERKFDFMDQDKWMYDKDGELVIHFEKERPYHLAQCVKSKHETDKRRKLEIEDTNVFEVQTKDIHLTDNKRNWNEEIVSFDDFMSKEYYSDPITLL